MPLRTLLQVAKQGWNLRKTWSQIDALLTDAAAKILQLHAKAKTGEKGIGAANLGVGDHIAASNRSTSSAS